MPQGNKLKYVYFYYEYLKHCLYNIISKRLLKIPNTIDVSEDFESMVWTNSSEKQLR